MLEHDIYMKRCLELAVLDPGAVSPNPMVGALIACGDKVIGEGWHQRYGGPHAEVNAINDVLSNHVDGEELLKKSRIYVSLEPCSHQGKTPPCTDLIIKHGIPDVIFACRDPFPRVNGQGAEKLRKAGINVTEGILEKEARHLNRRFFTRIQKQRPYLILKWAETADGYFAPADGSQQWISGTQAKQLNHRWRSEEDAVLIGKNTALADNPQLTTRLWPGKNPKRIILDRNGELPAHLHVFDQTVETIVLTAEKTDWQPQLKHIALESFDNYLAESIAYQLYLLDIQSVIIEGGAKTLALFLQAGLWDEARIFKSQTCWGKGLPAPRLHAKAASTQTLGNDSLSIYYH